VSITTLTSKGQTTIPHDVRAYLGLHTGDKLEFLIDASGDVILKPHTTDAKELKSLLPKTKRKVSVEQMNAAIKKRGGNL
jgi:antitoxin PrlF